LHTWVRGVAYEALNTWVSPLSLNLQLKGRLCSYITSANLTYRTYFQIEIRDVDNDALTWIGCRCIQGDRVFKELLI